MISTGSKGPFFCPPHQAQKMHHLLSSMYFEDKLGTAILSAVSLENEELTKRSLDSLQVYSCSLPGSRQVSGLIKRQIQAIQKPRLGQPSQNHEEKLEIRLTQLGQDLGGKLMRREGVSPQDLP